MYECEAWTISKMLQKKKKPGGNRNVVLAENAMNLMDCKKKKKIKQNIVTIS